MIKIVKNKENSILTFGKLKCGDCFLGGPDTTHVMMKVEETNYVNAIDLTTAKPYSLMKDMVIAAVIDPILTY